MKFRPKNSIQKFQMGGEVAPEAEPMEGQGVPENAPENAPANESNDPIMQLAQMAMQALQNQDCNAAMQVCQVFVQMLQQGQPQGSQQGEPVFRKGGILVKRVRK